MKIQRFVLINIVVAFLAISVVSAGFYYVERMITLRYVATALNQSIFNLEEDLSKALQDNRSDSIQTLLDQSAAIDNAVAVFSLSHDGKTVSASSSRTLAGKMIAEGYLPVSQIQEGIRDHHLLYAAEITYFPESRQERALLLVELNEEFIYSRLNQIALFYGLSLFLVFGAVALSLYGVVRRWMIRPLEEIADRARKQETGHRDHLIEEFSLLDATLGESFRSMKIQQDHLREALDETRYLDGILRTVADINQYLLTARNVGELLHHSCNRLAQHPGYELCHIALRTNSSLVIEAFSNDATGYLYGGMKIDLDQEHLDERDPSVVAYTENETVIIDHLEHNTSLGAWRYIAEKGQFGSVIAIPLVETIDAPPIGVMTIYAKNSHGFEAKEIAMLEELAGDIGFAVGSFTQRTRLQYHLTTDAVTDLPNRFSLVEALERKGVSALAIINIDRFSDINDVYGITIGDAILSGYAHWLKRMIAAEPHISLYKMGSDEYALVYEECNDLSYCIAFLDRLIAMTQKESFVIEGIEIVLTITVGIAPASERVLEHATAALKEAKRKRRSLEVFSYEVKQEQGNNIAWYKRIKEAVEESRIVPFFQPIVDNATGRIIKYEALIRLIDTEGKVVSPYLFLEIAKKTKIYPELTKIMIDKVIARFKGSELPVSLNLSTQDLINPELADYLESTIMREGMGRLIIFEILESEGFENYDAVSAFVDRFKSIGCRFAIDDFGSGYSNFDHLLKLNVDTIKIDGTLIKNLPHDRNAQIFVKHIAEFAHEMGISTVAEFVSSEEIYERVKASGVDASQGYYFYEPSAELVEP
ncbi:MAG: EAL domain-containing protein [Sulfuricurvum sp.]|nr:GGDEF domain-containing protein [Sulfuricurvum sp.]